MRLQLMFELWLMSLFLSFIFPFLVAILYSLFPATGTTKMQNPKSWSRKSHPPPNSMSNKLTYSMHVY